VIEIHSEIVYGIGGYCADCDPSHDHPLNNVVSYREWEVEVEEPQADTQALADALAQLPPDTLNALKQALGL
jgi:hypothetical protein